MGSGNYYCIPGRLIKAVKVVFIFLAVSKNVSAQQAISLYDGPAPGSESWNWTEKEFFAKAPINAKVLYNISTPGLTVFKPEKPNGCAVIVSPGGGFRVLNYAHEGTRIADSLTNYGITVFVFKYRLVRAITDDPWQETLKAVRTPDSASIQQTREIAAMARTDLQLAIKKVRSLASQFHFDSNRVGLLGFSAGAAMSSDIAYNFTDDARPNFVAPIYGVIKLNSERTVKPSAPPLFIAAATDDSLAKVIHSVEIYKDWMNAKISAELHLYAKGGHGMRGTHAADWIMRFVSWLKLLGFLAKKD